MNQLTFVFQSDDDPDIVNGCSVDDFLADLADAVMELEGEAESSTITQTEIVAALDALKSSAYDRKGKWFKDRFGFPVLVRSDGREYLHFHRQYDVHKEPVGVLAVAYPLDAETAKIKGFRSCRLSHFPKQIAAGVMAE